MRLASSADRERAHVKVQVIGVLGTLLGVLTDFFGNTIQEIRAPFSGELGIRHRDGYLRHARAEGAAEAAAYFRRVHLAQDRGRLGHVACRHANPHTAGRLQQLGKGTFADEPAVVDDADDIGEHLHLVQEMARRGVAIIVGIIAGLAPAIRAASLDPVDALRYDVVPMLPSATSPSTAALRVLQQEGAASCCGTPSDS